MDTKKIISRASVLMFWALSLLCSVHLPAATPGFSVKLSKEVLLDKIKGGWGGQTIGCTYGGPTEFKYSGIIGDGVKLGWNENSVKWYFDHSPGLYDDIYMDLTFVEVFQKEGLDAPIESFAKAYANAPYPLWHANKQGRYNILNGIMPPESGYWENNPHADDIDFQIEDIPDFDGTEFHLNMMEILLGWRFRHADDAGFIRIRVNDDAARLADGELGTFKAREKEWAAADEFVTLGNHTYTHGKIPDRAALEKEFSQCNEVIARLRPKQKGPISFAIPAAESMHKVLEITDEELADAYRRNNLVERFPWHGYPVQCKTIPEMEAYVDSVLASGGFGHMDFHGVGGDWLDPGLDYFKALLKKLDEHRDDVWFTTHIELVQWLEKNKSRSCGTGGK